MNFALRIYRRLAQAFPHEFKMAYGHEIMQLGEDVVPEMAKRQGAGGLIRLIADIAIRVPIEYLSEMRHDMRYATRALIKSPGFALVGIVSMGLGIGLTTNVYGSKWALLTRAAPASGERPTVGDARETCVVLLRRAISGAKEPVYRSGRVPERRPLQRQHRKDTWDAKPERVFGQLVSADYFSVLGVEPQRGRLLSPELDKPGDAPVVVISDRFWRSRLNSSPNAVGQTLRLNGQTATIVGITPRNFDGALSMNPSELFVPTTVPATLAPELANDVLHQRNAKEFLALMCLAPGVTIDAAEASLDGITRRLDEQDPSAPRQADKAKRVVLTSGGHQGADSPEFEACNRRLLCRVDGTDHDHRVHEPGNHAARAGRQSPQGTGDSPGCRCQPLSADPADDQRRHSAFAAGRGSGIRARVWSFCVERASTAISRGRLSHPTSHWIGAQPSSRSPSPSCAASDSAWRRPCKRPEPMWPRRSKRARRFNCLATGVLACATWPW